jgi:hypothetical protein
LCRQYEDLPTVIQTSADLSCIYATRALFHLMKETKNPLYEQILNKDYKFPSVEQLSHVTSRTQLLCKKYFKKYWNMGGRENAFLKAKKKMEKVRLKILLIFLLHSYIYIFCTNILFCFLQQLEKEIAADEKLQREQDKYEEENARYDDVGDHPF